MGESEASRGSGDLGAGQGWGFPTPEGDGKEARCHIFVALHSSGTVQFLTNHSALDGKATGRLKVESEHPGKPIGLPTLTSSILGHAEARRIEANRYGREHAPTIKRKSPAP